MVDLILKLFQSSSPYVYFAMSAPDPYTDGEVGEGDNDANGGDDPQVPGLLVHLLLRIVVPLLTRLHRVVAHGEAAGQITPFEDLTRSRRNQNLEETRFDKNSNRFIQIMPSERFGFTKHLIL